MNRSNRSLRLILTIVGLVLIIFVIVFFLSTTIVESIYIRGNEHYTRQEILELTGLSDTDSVLDLLLNHNTIVENSGYIDKLEIIKKDLKNVEVIIKEKEIIGYVEFMGQYICLDREGYIIDYSSNVDEGKPMITGIELESFTAMEPLDVSPDIVKAIETIYSSAKAFNLPLEWIDFRYREASDIRLIIKGLDVHIGNVVKMDAKSKAIAEILKVLPEGKKGTLYVEDIEHDIFFESEEDGNMKEEFDLDLEESNPGESNQEDVNQDD